MNFIGIDVGKNGGIASIIDNELLLRPIPEYILQIQDVLHSISVISPLDDVSIAIEDVHSIYGTSAKSNFQFGRILGMKEAFCFTVFGKYELVQPKVWQKAVWEPSDMVKKEDGKTDTKATSLNAAQRIFPNEKFLKTKRSTVPHDGLVDASLIAYYLKLNYETTNG